MNYGNLEKISSVILRPAPNFTIKNVVQFGKRNYRNGQREDALKQSCYNSNKYNNYNHVGQISIETSDFLVFKCGSLVDPKKFIEIYMSYQHMMDVKAKFREIYEFVINNIDDIYKVLNDNMYINPKYESYSVRIKNLVNNTSIMMILDILEDDEDDYVIYKEAISLYFNDEDIYTIISIDDLAGIVYFLDNFNLLSSSQNLMMFAYMNQIASSLELKNYEIKPFINSNNRVSIPKRSKKEKEDIDYEENNE